MPLGLGMLARRFAAVPAAWLEPKLRRLGSVLPLVLPVLVLIDIWQEVIGARVRVALAVMMVTALALALGHLLGGAEPLTRTATAISSAARNPGLALRVATLNAASPAITRAVLGYFVVAAVTMIPYVIWRRRVAKAVRANT